MFSQKNELHCDMNAVIKDVLDCIYYSSHTSYISSARLSQIKLLFNHCVGEGKSYVFFCEPDTEHFPDAYLYPFGEPYLSDMLPVLQPFTEYFDISYIEVIDVLNDGKAGKAIETRTL